MRIICNAILVGLVTSSVAVAEPSNPPKVLAVYPETAVVPKNLLRLYIEFDQTMSQGRLLNSVRLLDENGNQIESPFLNLYQELWSPDQTIATIVFDPGRIKTGVGSNLFAGAPLKSGSSYTLEISGPIESSTNKLSVVAFQKELRVGSAQRLPLMPGGWDVYAPRAETVNPVIVKTGLVMDAGALSSNMRVLDASDKPVSGQYSLASNSTDIVFTPAKPWGAGQHRIWISSNLEDASGNRPGIAFEEKQGRSKSGPYETVLSFLVQ